MNTTRSGRIKRSILSTLILQVITVFCGLITPRLLLKSYGSEAYGATTSIAQFLSYITLLEGGIGGVARAAFYKPLAENDSKRISLIVYELKRFFRIIAYISAAYAVVLGFLFKRISHIECYDWLSTFLLVIAMAVSVFGQYFIGISYSALIQADQRVYFINLLSILTTVLNTIMVVILVKLGAGLIFVKLVSSVVFLIKPTAMWYFVHKHYHIEKTPGYDKTVLSQKWTGLGQHIAFYIHSNTDVTVLTILENLKTVSVYSMYTMVTTHIRSIVEALCSGMAALFGDMYAREETENLNRAFNFYEMLTSFVCTVLFSTVYVMIIPFIRLYTRGVTDINYIQPLFGYLITMAAEVYCLRNPYQSVISAAGHFKQTRAGSYGEAVINIAVSVLLVWKYGLVGVAIGTIAAVTFRMIYCVVYLKSSILKRPIPAFVKRSLLNIGITVTICFICRVFVSRAVFSNYFIWAEYSTLTVLTSAVISFLFNYIFYRDETIRFMILLKNKIKRNSSR